jgi:hypothetical protein
VQKCGILKPDFIFDDCNAPRIAPVNSWKDAIFMFESASVPDELKLVDSIAERFKPFPEAENTLIQVTHSLEEAAVVIDKFKARTCGSAYSLAVVNLNMFGNMQEFNFLMSPSVLGDPRIIFVASLKSMAGESYAFAKNKVHREGETSLGAPSCIDCYSAANREEASERLAKLACAYLHEFDERANAKRGRTSVLLNSEALNQLKNSTTTYYGNRGRTSGIYRPVDPGSSKH